MALVARYPFTAGAGSTAADTSGSGRPLTGSAWVASARTGPGAGGAWVASTAGIGAAATAAFTLMMWVRIVTLPTGFTGLATSSTANRWFEISNVAGAVRLDYFTGTSQLDATSTFPLATATHLAVVHNGVMSTLYLNGVAAGTVGGSSATTDLSATDWTVGGGNGDDPISGGDWIDEVQVFDTALTAGEITTLMNTPLDGAAGPPEEVYRRPSWPPFWLPVPGPQAQSLQMMGDRTPAAPAYAGDGPVATTSTVVAAGSVSTPSGSTTTTTSTIAASGVVGLSSGGPLATTVTVTAAGSLTVPEADQMQARPQLAWMFLQPSAASQQLQGDRTAVEAGSGSAAQAVSSTVTAAGQLGTGSGSASAASSTVTAAGQVGTAAGSTTTTTATVVAAGVVAGPGASSVAVISSVTAQGGTEGSAARATVVTVVAAGSVTGGPAGSADRPTISTVTAAGVLGTVSGADRLTTVTVVAAGVVATSAGATRAVVATVTATGSLLFTGGTVSGVTVTVTAAGVVSVLPPATEGYAGAGTAPRGPYAGRGT